MSGLKNESRRLQQQTTGRHRWIRRSENIIKRFVSTQTNILWPSRACALAETPKNITYANPPGSFSDKNDEAGRVDSAGCAGTDISRLLFHPVIELHTFSSGSLISVSSPFCIYIQFILYTMVRFCSRPTVFYVKDFCRVPLDTRKRDSSFFIYTSCSPT